MFSLPHIAIVSLIILLLAGCAGRPTHSAIPQAAPRLDSIPDPRAAKSRILQCFDAQRGRIVDIVTDPENLADHVDPKQSHGTGLITLFGRAENDTRAESDDTSFRFSSRTRLKGNLRASGHAHLDSDALKILPDCRDIQPF